MSDDDEVALKDLILCNSLCCCTQALCFSKRLTRGEPPPPPPPHHTAGGRCKTVLFFDLAHAGALRLVPRLHRLLRYVDHLLLRARRLPQAAVHAARVRLLRAQDGAMRGVLRRREADLLHR